MSERASTQLLYLPVRPQKRPPHATGALTTLVAPEANVKPPPTSSGIPPLGCTPTHTVKLHEFTKLNDVPLALPAIKTCQHSVPCFFFFFITPQPPPSLNQSLDSYAIAFLSNNPTTRLALV